MRQPERLKALTPSLAKASREGQEIRAINPIATRKLNMSAYLSCWRRNAWPISKAVNLMLKPEKSKGKSAFRVLKRAVFRRIAR